MARITSSLANAALGATGVSVAPLAVEVVHAIPSTQRKGVHLGIVKWVSRVRITHRSVRWAMKSKNNNSVPNAMVSVVKDEEVLNADAPDINSIRNDVVKLFVGCNNSTAKVDTVISAKMFDEMPLRLE